MLFHSYCDVFGIAPIRYNDPAAVGDLVASGPNGHPRFRVVAEHDEHCWLRNEDTGAYGQAERVRLRVIERACPS